MNELMNARRNKRESKWQLLATVSALTLLVGTYGTNEAKAASQDADQPTVWIELGGQLVHVNGQGNSFPVKFLAANPDSPVLQPTTPLQAQRPIPFGFAEEGKLSLQPEGSNWVFSAGVNYGRSNNFKHVDHQTNGTHVSRSSDGAPIANIHGTDDFADTQVRHNESHTILDFSAGKDVGLGIFGKDGSAVVSLGIRIAQFASQGTFDVRARPDLRVKYFTPGTHRAPLLYFHTYHNTGQASRSFHGVGPSLSWNGSTPVVGNTQDGEITFDLGANAAVLFGKQKARVRHHESGHYKTGIHKYNAQVYQYSGGHNTDRSVTVPNIGGFAGASFRVENFKLSLGYRADFFFGAIDGGIDAPKSETLGFYGPFTSISIGLP